MSAVPTAPSLTPQQRKALRDQHPLYRRLSGEGVWVFLEELGLDEGQCERFMDAFFRQMDHILSCMAALNASSRLQGQIIGRPEDCCPACATSIGRYMSSGGGGAWDLLPPFGIGCPLSLRLGHPEEPPAAGSTLLPDAVKEPSILCARLAADPADGLRRFLAAVQPADTEI